MEFLKIFHSILGHGSNWLAFVCLHWELADAAIERLYNSIANTPANPTYIFIVREIKSYKAFISIGITVTISKHLSISYLYSVSIQPFYLMLLSFSSIFAGSGN